MRPMKIKVLTLIAIVCLPQTVFPQKRTTLTVAAGPSFPIGGLKDTQQRGLDVDIALISGSDESSIGFRLDATYDRLPGRIVSAVKQGSLRIFSGDASIVISLPGGLAKPYLLGGAGAYRVKSEVPGSKASTRPGFGFGAGLVLTTPGRPLFIESRIQSVSQKNAKPLRYAPVVLGIIF